MGQAAPSPCLLPMCTSTSWKPSTPLGLWVQFRSIRQDGTLPPQRLWRGRHTGGAGCAPGTQAAGGPPAHHAAGSALRGHGWTVGHTQPAGDTLGSWVGKAALLPPTLTALLGTWSHAQARPGRSSGSPGCGAERGYQASGAALQPSSSRGPRAQTFPAAAVWPGCAGVGTACSWKPCGSSGCSKPRRAASCERSKGGACRGQACGCLRSPTAGPLTSTSWLRARRGTVTTKVVRCIASLPSKIFQSLLAWAAGEHVQVRG